MTATKKQTTRWLCRNCEGVTQAKKNPLTKCPECGSADLVKLWKKK